MADTTGKNIEFAIYYDVSGTQTAFHNIVLHKSVYESSVMGLNDKISGDFYYQNNTLTFSMKEYIVYDGVKYYILNPPTIVKEGMVADNSELRGMTRYSVEFYHPMCELSNMPFTDVAVSNDEMQYKSQDKTFYWIGNIQDFIVKLNKNLQGTQWAVLRSTSLDGSDKLTELSDVMSFSDKSIAECLKDAYDTWGIPFVIVSIHSGEYYNTIDGRQHNPSTDVDYYSVAGGSKRFAIIFGLPDNEIYQVDAQGNFILDDNDQKIPYTFQIGQGLGLKNNSRTPKNNKIVTRIAGYGSERNIPYGYPQIPWYGDGDATSTLGGSVGIKSSVVVNGTTYTNIMSYPIYEGIVGGQYMKLIKHPFTRNHLMPSCYYESVFNKVSPYNSDGTANTNFNPNLDIKDYYDAVSDASYTYPHEINTAAPSYDIHEFDVYPRLGEETLPHDAEPYQSVEDAVLGLGEKYISWSRFETIKDEYDAKYEDDQRLHDALFGSQNGIFTVMESEDQAQAESHGDGYEWMWNFHYGEDFVDVEFHYQSQESTPTVQLQFNYLIVQEGVTLPVDWDDSVTDNGEVVQSYFYLYLPQLSFDIYACAALTEKMQINMLSGACIGCTFEIQVDWERYRNVFYDDEGNFAPLGDKRMGALDEFPRSDLAPIKVIAAKDINTFGTPLPSIYQQPKYGDKFVVLGISLPETYIRTAEQNLDTEMKTYMLENNVYYYDYPFRFDEYFLAKNINILKQIKNNSKVRFLFGNEYIYLYVQKICIKFGENVLPQYDISFTDNIEVITNKIGETISQEIKHIVVGDNQNTQISQGGSSGGGNSNIQIYQTTGTHADGVMSQRAVTQKLQENGIKKITLSHVNLCHSNTDLSWGSQVSHGYYYIVDDTDTDKVIGTLICNDEDTGYGSMNVFGYLNVVTSNGVQYVEYDDQSETISWFVSYRTSESHPNPHGSGPMVLTYPWSNWQQCFKGVNVDTTPQQNGGNAISSGWAYTAEQAIEGNHIVHNATAGTSGTAAVTSSGSYKAAIWRVDLSSEITELYTGLTILFKVPVAGNGTYGTLLRIDGATVADDSSDNLYPVCANVNSMISTRYAVGCIIALTFDADQVGQTLYYSGASYTTIAAGTGWTKKGCWKIAAYDTNTTTTYGTLDYYFRPYTAARLTPYKVVALDKDNRVIPITTEQYCGSYSSSTSYVVNDIVLYSGSYYKSLANSNKNHTPSTSTSYWQVYTMPSQFTPTTTPFRPEKLRFYNSTNLIASGAVTGGQTLIEIGYSTGVCSYTFWASIPKYNVIYLQGTYDKTTGLFTLDTGANYYKLVPDNTANLTLSSYFTSGKYYILLGATYSTDNYFQLFMVNTLYYFDGTNLFPFETKVAKDEAGAITNASLGQGYGTCSTAASTAAKEVTLANYALTLGGVVSVKFDYDVPANATMSINGKDAKAIYYHNAAITDGIIKGGDVATFIYSTYYHLISIDRGTGGDVECPILEPSGSITIGSDTFTGSDLFLENFPTNTSTSPTATLSQEDMASLGFTADILDGIISKKYLRIQELYDGDYEEDYRTYEVCNVYTAPKETDYEITNYRKWFTLRWDTYKEWQFYGEGEGDEDDTWTVTFFNGITTNIVQNGQAAVKGGAIYTALSNKADTSALSQVSGVVGILQSYFTSDKATKALYADEAGDADHADVADEATVATTATNLADAPTATISGNTISLTVGGKTSSPITIPYATKAAQDEDGTNIKASYLKKNDAKFVSWNENQNLGSAYQETARNNIDSENLAVGYYYTGNVWYVDVGNISNSYSGTVSMYVGSSYVTSDTISGSSYDALMEDLVGVWTNLGFEATWQRVGMSGYQLIIKSDVLSFNAPSWSGTPSSMNFSVSYPQNISVGFWKTFNPLSISYSDYIQPSARKLYVDLHYNQIYRCDGSSYVPLVSAAFTNAEYSSQTSSLIFYFGGQSVSVPLGNLVPTFTAGKGIEISGTQIAQNYLVVTEQQMEDYLASQQDDGRIRYVYEE